VADRARPPGWIAALADALRLYRHYAVVSLRGQMHYRASVVAASFGVFAITAVEFAAVWALFDRFGQLRGWRLPEIAMYYGMSSISWAVCDSFSRGLSAFGQMIKAGGFDRLLMRPRSTVIQLLGQELTVRRVGRLAQGMVVLGYAAASGVIDWTPARAALLAAALVAGVCVFLGLLVLQATSAFWTVDSLEVWNAFTYGGNVMAQYPLSIYRGWFRALFLYAIPVGFALYYPGLAILGRADPLGAPPIVSWLAPLAGPVFLALCLQAWRLGVRHYQSTGS
jgi:ABC-2 type transport system permease protein